MQEKIVSKDKTLVIIDEGHGVDTPGKRTEHDWGTFYEWSYNRQIGYNVSNYLQQSGINHVMLVNSDKDVSLKERIRRVHEIKNKYSDYKIFLISLHGNAAGVESANGYEVFTSPSRNLSDKIATIFFNNAKKLGFKMRADFSDGDPDKEARFYMLTESPVWAILIENGFYTNKEEAKLMMTSSFQDKIARNLVQSIKLVFDYILK